MEFDEWKEKWLIGKYVGEYILGLRDVEVRCPKDGAIVNGVIYDEVDIIIEGILDEYIGNLRSEQMERAIKELEKKFGNACWEIDVDKYKCEVRAIITLYAGYRNKVET